MLFTCTICEQPANNLFYVTVKFNNLLVKKGPICPRHIQKLITRDDTIIAESLVPEGFGEDEDIEIVIDES